MSYPTPGPSPKRGGERQTVRTSLPPPFRRGAGGAVALLLALACSKPAPPPPAPKDAGPTCQSNADCPSGEVCDTATGTCGPCKSSGQCKPHQECKAPSVSQPNACVYQSGWGDACKLNDECPAGQLCKQGLCVSGTDVQLCPDLRCPAGQRCNRVNLVCEQDSGCFSDAECDATQLCNPGTHRCDLRCTEENANTVCAAGQKCVSGRCAQCGSDADCPGGLTCDTSAGRCTNGLTCFSDRDCVTPLVCNAATSQCTQAPPPCVADEQCKIDETCDVPHGRCIPRGCQPDKYEPNHDQAHAAAIGPGPDIKINGLTLCGGEEDYFSFALLQGDLVQVVTEADPLASGTFDTTLLDPLGRALNRGDLVAQGQADSDGTYAVRVHSTDPIQSYGLRVQIDHTSVSCQNDTLEPNDTVPQATRLAPPGLDTLAICAGDHDWYYLDVPAGLGAHLEVDADPNRGEVDLYVYASDATTLLGASANPGATEVVDLGSAQAGGQRLYVLVQGVEARSQNQYSLASSFRLDAPDAGPADAGVADAGVDAGTDLDAGPDADAGTNSDGGAP